MLAGADRDRPAGPGGRRAGARHPRLEPGRAPTKPDAVDAGRRARRCRVRRRHFGYAARRAGARRASTCTCAPGETVALVGASGRASRPSRCCCRASTTCRTGPVRIDGVDVRDADAATRCAADRRRVRGGFLFSDVRAGQHRLRPARRDRGRDRRRRPRRPRPTSSSAACRTATTPSSASRASRCRAASASASRSPARCITDPRVLHARRRDLGGRRRDRGGRSTRTPARDDRWPAAPRSSSPTAGRRCGSPTGSSSLDGGRVVDDGTHDELMARMRASTALLLAGPRRRGRPADAAMAATDGRGRRADVDATASTPQAWPHGRVDGARDLVGDGGLAAPPAAAAGRGGGGGRRRRGMGSAARRPTPRAARQLADALPPADDDPERRRRRSRAAPPSRTSRCARFLRPFRAALLARAHARRRSTRWPDAARPVPRQARHRPRRRRSDTRPCSWPRVGASSARARRLVRHLAATRGSPGAPPSGCSTRCASGSSPTSSGSSLDYYDRELAGRIMTRMTTDVEALSQLAADRARSPPLVSVLTFVGVLVVARHPVSRRSALGVARRAPAAGDRDDAGTAGASRARPTRRPATRIAQRQRRPPGEPLGRARRPGLRPRGAATSTRFRRPQRRATSTPGSRSQRLHRRSTSRSSSCSPTLAAASCSASARAGRTTAS